MAAGSPFDAPSHRPSTIQCAIAALVDAHGAALLRLARQYSLCLDDAHDAYQRAPRSTCAGSRRWTRSPKARG
jgi:DNA-directed RNA polymerase specialized sigma24 family protein